ncbi:MAG: ABC transporter permease [Candidatus Thermoplasmatota archaeon]|nr:ABC transporter permease [Candidatus Thermoplasmatota archaeon]
MNPKFILYFAWYYGFYVILRGASYLLASLSLPLALLFMVTIFTHGTLIAFAIAGGPIAIVAANSINGAGDAAFFRIQIRIQDLFVATSITSQDYMFALSMSYLVFSLPGIVLYAILGAYFKVFSLSSLLPIVGVLVLLTLTISNLSFIIAGLLKHIRNVWGITAILSIIMTVLPPTFYPYTFLPQGVIYILSVSPVTPAAVLIQGIVGLEPMQFSMIFILFTETILFTLLGRKFIRWRE